jgi:hypothetical protein
MGTPPDLAAVALPDAGPGVAPEEPLLGADAGGAGLPHAPTNGTTPAAIDIALEN